MNQDVANTETAESKTESKAERLAAIAHILYWRTPGHHEAKTWLQNEATK
jgi:hypothetical protein